MLSNFLASDGLLLIVSLLLATSAYLFYLAVTGAEDE